MTAFGGFAMKTRTVVMGILAALAPMGTALAGVTLTMNAEGPKKQTVIYLEGNKMRIDAVQGSGAKASSFIFDGDAKKTITFNSEKKTYTEMKGEDLKALRAQSAQRMHDSLAQMTPEQRKRMEEMMSGQTPPKESKKTREKRDIKWENTGGQQTVAGFACHNFKEIREGKTDAQGCYISWNAGAVTKADLAPMMKMGEFMADSGMAEGDNRFSQLTELPGFPGKWAQLSADGKPEEEQTVTSIKRGSVPSDKFRPPAEYTQDKRASLPKP
jgi:hypothetical protein